MSGFEKIRADKLARAEARSRGDFAWDESQHPRAPDGKFGVGDKVTIKEGHSYHGSHGKVITERDHSGYHQVRLSGALAGKILHVADWELRPKKSTVKLGGELVRGRGGHSGEARRSDGRTTPIFIPDKGRK